VNKQGFDALEAIHCRAAKIIYNLAMDIPTIKVRQLALWDKLSDR